MNQQGVRRSLWGRQRKPQPGHQPDKGDGASRHTGVGAHLTSGFNAVVGPV